MRSKNTAAVATSEELRLPLLTSLLPLRCGKQLVITELTRLWWQLLPLTCHPSFYLLLISVQEHFKKTWREFMDKNGWLLQTLGSMPKWESVLSACLFGRLNKLTFHKKQWQFRLQERWDNTSCFWLDCTQSPCKPLVVISCFWCRLSGVEPRMVEKLFKISQGIPLSNHKREVLSHLLMSECPYFFFFVFFKCCVFCASFTNPSSSRLLVVIHF